MICSGQIYITEIILHLVENLLGSFLRKSISMSSGRIWFRGGLFLSLNNNLLVIPIPSTTVVLTMMLFLMVMMMMMMMMLDRNVMRVRMMVVLNRHH